MGDVIWHGDQVLVAIRGLSAKRVQAAGIHLKNRIQEKLSDSSSPSAPGEYPAKVTGHLRRNIVATFDAAAVTSRVGTNVPYGRYLELGTANMAPRPFLANALRDFASELKGLIESGKVEAGMKGAAQYEVEGAE